MKSRPKESNVYLDGTGPFIITIKSNKNARNRASSLNSIDKSKPQKDSGDCEPTPPSEVLMDGGKRFDLPVLTERHHGPGCAMEIAVLERHGGTCPYKKTDSKNRHTGDDRVGSYDCIGRLVFRTCTLSDVETDYRSEERKRDSYPRRTSSSSSLKSNTARSVITRSTIHRGLFGKEVKDKKASKKKQNDTTATNVEFRVAEQKPASTNPEKQRESGANDEEPKPGNTQSILDNQLGSNEINKEKQDLTVKKISPLNRSSEPERIRKTKVISSSSAKPRERPSKYHKVKEVALKSSPDVLKRARHPPSEKTDNLNSECLQQPTKAASKIFSFITKHFFAKSSKEKLSKRPSKGNEIKKKSCGDKKSDSKANYEKQNVNRSKRKSGESRHGSTKTCVDVQSETKGNRAAKNIITSDRCNEAKNTRKSKVISCSSEYSSKYHTRKKVPLKTDLLLDKKARQKLSDKTIVLFPDSSPKPSKLHAFFAKHFYNRSSGEILPKEAKAQDKRS